MNDFNANGNNNCTIYQGDIRIDSAITPAQMGNLAEVVNQLAQIDLSSIDATMQSDMSPYGIAEKMDYNNVLVYRDVISAYGSYGKVLNDIYDELEKSCPGRKSKIDLIIAQEYLLCRGKFMREGNISEISLVLKLHSDDIIMAVIEKLKGMVRLSSNTAASVEDVEINVLVIVADAFIRCKILERPPSESL